MFPEKSWMWLVGAESWTSYYFHGTSYLFDKQTRLARLGNVAGIFSEMNSELAVSRKDRYFFPMKKIQVFERESELWKTCIHHHSELTGQLPSDCFSDGSVRLLMNVMFGYCIIKYVSIWKIRTAEWTSIFCMTSACKIYLQVAG